MLIVQKELEWPVSSWEKAEAFARRIVDGAECPIDPGILETVVALNLLGLQTCQSCEGHLDHGTAYPWIDFETDEFPTFKQALADASQEGLSAEEREERGAQLVALAAGLSSRGVLYARLEELLSIYHRQPPSLAEEWRIIVDWRSPILFRLMPECAYESEEWPPDARADNLARAQAEMQAFTAFLKQLFFRVQEAA